MVGDGHLRNDVSALGEAGVHEVLVLLQRLLDHLQFRVHVGQKEVLHPAVSQRQRLELEEDQRMDFFFF